MKNGDKPAYPVPIAGSTDGCIYNVLDASGGLLGGLTKREEFAKFAPDVPDWFEYEPEVEKPNQPKSWVDMPDGDDKDLCKQWHHDPCFDLPDELQWYQSSWEDYDEKKQEYNITMKHDRYFAWRIYYADALLKALEQNEEK